MFAHLLVRTEFYFVPDCLQVGDEYSSDESSDAESTSSTVEVGKGSAISAQVNGHEVRMRDTESIGSNVYMTYVKSCHTCGELFE